MKGGTAREGGRLSPRPTDETDANTSAYGQPSFGTGSLQSSMRHFGNFSLSFSTPMRVTFVPLTFR